MADRDEVMEAVSLTRRKVLRDGRIVVGGGMLIVLALVAIFADWLAPHDPIEQDLLNRFAPRSSEFILGTDAFGRDILSRLIVGARYSMLIGVVSVAIGGIVGGALGMIAGYLRGWVDVVLMRITDALLAFPLLLVALVLVATLGSSLPNLVAAIAVAVIPRFVRIVRGAVIEVEALDYVTAAKVIGAPTLRILRTDILPNIASPIIVTASFMLASAVLVEASLGFLGLGIQPPTPTWGNMINEALPRLRLQPMPAVYPGLAIMLAVLAMNLVGDGLRDILDPRTERAVQ
ncbi:MAG TPA: ABC transporter permease [Acidimicrobiia bacterium]